MAPRIALALRVGPERGRMRRCKDSPGVEPVCALRLASTPFPIQRGPIPKPDRLLAQLYLDGRAQGCASVACLGVVQVVNGVLVGVA